MQFFFSNCSVFISPIFIYFTIVDHFDHDLLSDWLEQIYLWTLPLWRLDKASGPPAPTPHPALVSTLLLHLLLHAPVYLVDCEGKLCFQFWITMALGVQSKGPLIRLLTLAEQVQVLVLAAQVEVGNCQEWDLLTDYPFDGLKVVLLCFCIFQIMLQADNCLLYFLDSYHRMSLCFLMAIKFDKNKS